MCINEAQLTYIVDIVTVRCIVLYHDVILITGIGKFRIIITTEGIGYCTGYLTRINAVDRHFLSVQADLDLRFRIFCTELYIFGTRCFFDEFFHLQGRFLYRCTVRPFYQYLYITLCCITHDIHLTYGHFRARNGADGIEHFLGKFAGRDSTFFLVDQFYVDLRKVTVAGCSHTIAGVTHIAEQVNHFRLAQQYFFCLLCTHTGLVQGCLWFQFQLDHHLPFITFTDE
ncbi:hypothetical protein D3C86_1158260 [compost metagenome]